MSRQPLDEPFALLDDCQASSAHPRSRLYTGWVRSLVCRDGTDLPGVLARARQALQQEGLFALLLADYEWGGALQGVRPGRGETGCLRIELYRAMRKMSASDADDWLAEQAGAREQEAGLLAWQSALGEPEFAAAIARIRQAIARGETYQVNYTFAFHGRAYGSPLQLYRLLRQRQSVEFGALLRLGDEAARDAQAGWVLSFSPELFLRGEGRRITARPMKGTAPAGASEAETAQAAQWLRQDAKNRAENVMIVDLLRNDLGRVAEPGSVQVRDLFRVQRNGTVLSMTSTVQARLQANAGLADVLRGSFPCGSITGAPKHQTMQLIRELEQYRRGIYTGAIGWLDAQDTPAISAAGAGGHAAPLWNFCLSVPIRTLFLREQDEGAHTVRLPVGAGIVWDSDAAQEWQECLLKSRFATASDPGFALFETMRVDAGQRIHNLVAHLRRLAASAAALGFRFDAQAVDAALQAHAATLPSQPHRLRLALQADGRVEITHGVLADLPGAEPVSLLLADAPCRTPAWLRRHKTTLRREYDEAMRYAERQGAFDCLFFNERGHLTEGARTNVFVQLRGQWLTPPVGDGLLPGTARQQVLDDARWQAREQSITRHDVLQADAIMVCNALRGALPARLLP